MLGAPWRIIIRYIGEDILQVAFCILSNYDLKSN
jgi:hypothetical protein